MLSREDSTPDLPQTPSHSAADAEVAQITSSRNKPAEDRDRMHDEALADIQRISDMITEKNRQIDTLEERVHALTNENAQLRKQLKQGATAHKLFKAAPKKEAKPQIATVKSHSLKP